MERQLFGTDGIRGVAGEPPLDPRTVHAVGAALGAWCKQHGTPPSVLIGMDTRESGSWIAAQVAGGLEREGITAHFAGLITTPGVAYLTKTGDFAAGVMISASHNPYRDNGIKVFGHSGYKLPDREELSLERDILAWRDSLDPRARELSVEVDLDEDYLAHLVSTFPGDLRGVTIVLDCGNGAATHLAPALFERLGAKVVRLNCAPDGRNINLNCGALHVEGLQAAVVANKAAAGFAFDGDADRCIAVAPSGRVVDGDAMLLLTAHHLLLQGKLAGSDGKPLVVATVMSNLGLEKALHAEGIELVRTPVGDKYVLEEMIRRGAPIGGEQSGHVIFLEHATTGDGMLTAVRVMEVVKHSGRTLDELAQGLTAYPQKLVNVRVQQRRPLDELPAVCGEIAAAEKELGDEGRVLVRFSGTEPLARVMVEGPTHEAVLALATRIAGAIQTELGQPR